METGIQVVEVALPLPMDRCLSYLVPEELREALQPGSRVLVPLGGRRLVGYAVGPPSAGDSGAHEVLRLRPLLDLLDERPLLSAELIEFSRRLSRYYLCSLGEVLKAALPPGLGGSPRSVLEEQPDPALRSPLRMTPQRESILRLVRQRGAVSRDYVEGHLQGATRHDLHELLRARFLVQREELRGLRGRGPTRRILALTAPPGAGEVRNLLELKRRRAPRQAELLERITATGGRLGRGEATALGFGAGVIQGLLGEDLVEERLEADTPEDEYGLDPSVLGIVLSEDQRMAVERVAEFLPRGKGAARTRSGKGPAYHAFLLWGVAGSGKTQIYLELARRALRLGRGVLVLVPEIALTPQIVARFRAFLGPRVAVIHSRIGQAGRRAVWEGLREDRIRVVIGARSAIFAPIPRLGLIVVDEEHENSFKQYDPAPRYNARDAAVLRAHQLGIPVVLGSATPSLETWQNCVEGRYERIDLPHRIHGRALPAVTLVDMRENLERLRGKGRTVRAFGDRLIQALIETLEQGRQAILLQNRRGHSTWLQCPDCGEALHCRHCDVTLVWHRADRLCHCHLCGMLQEAPQRCPACAGGPLVFLGTGTQKVEDELAEMFPDAKELRMDSDTTGARSAYIRMVDDFNQGRYSILLGTQSVAKGLDFSCVTLVGVINADTELNLQDFRAQEWGFQLVSQVAGRAGRGEHPGEVIVQSFNPGNPALVHAAAHDFPAFADGELAVRASLGYPPFARICRLVLKSTNEEQVRAACTAMFKEAQRDAEPLRVLNPGPAPVRMVRQEYRYHLIMKSLKSADPAGRLLHRKVRALQAHFDAKLKSRRLSLVVDMDPQGLM